MQKIYFLITIVSINIIIRVARIFNTYGPRMHPKDGRVVSNFIMKALQNNDITIYGDGEQTRGFCFVDDLLDGMQLFMNSEDSFRGPVNLGNSIQSKIIELAQKIISITGSNSRIINELLPEDD